MVMRNEAFLRLATVGLLVVAFVIGYVCGSASPPLAIAEVRADQLIVLQQNLDTLRRAWNGSKETTLRGLRLEPDSQGRYRVVGTTSQAESDRALSTATTAADEAYRRTFEPPSSNSP